MGIVVALAACASGRGGGSGGASFRVFYPDAQSGELRAKVGKRFYAKPVAQCTYDNGREGHWAMTGAKLDSGELPPGFTIEDGAIAGTADKPGSWTVRVKFSGVTCAGEPRDPQLVDLTLVAR
ncbi:MAG TPA: hypothetical protein VFQ53_18995 [Kofleriaceae bacterium]|nr:hypothetical protein [Kofleriaceae bacterium]